MGYGFRQEERTVWNEVPFIPLPCVDDQQAKCILFETVYAKGQLLMKRFTVTGKSLSRRREIIWYCLSYEPRRRMESSASKCWARRCRNRRLSETVCQETRACIVMSYRQRESPLDVTPVLPGCGIQTRQHLGPKALQFDQLVFVVLSSCCVNTVPGQPALVCSHTAEN